MEADITREIQRFPIDPSRPLYEQFVERIRAAIARGHLEPGARLPSVRELAAAIRVNPTTIQRTYQELERERLIVSYRGQGTFVTRDAGAIEASRRALAREAVARLRETAKSLGLTVQQLIDLARIEEEDG
ncbi:GntR family transcriptional regulator [Kyrpidia tusciae]|uniref:Transcriptional regulator, GntR family n=1 Tax=Kyrpidia tusciae (strain DSM 2912 / NBRC 15312 / T2) TaxID=562970 RepID=D5WSD6_KYRT2|nr:GntR family transcriptional regulator [Kyrpidia tusciae]ADG05021.1 transcriptional regulator, GntR family [Kyrpidia tusciae DSM 2912]